MPNTEADENIRKQIKEQISFNKGKNLFTAAGSHSLQFIEGTASLIDKIRTLDVQSEQLLIDYLADESLQEFCRVNQYFSFNTESVTELKMLYTELNQKIRLMNVDAQQSELDKLSQEHYTKLCDWLVRTNKFAETMYANDEEYVQPVACSEYAPDLQLRLLHIDLESLQEPILDIGCGRELNLVNYLRDNGFEAYGIDRFENNNPFYTKTDWLEYDYQPNFWGTVISNLGFSNHFVHHNLRVDGNFKVYAQKYMEILASLKTGGSFYYAPNLPFIEKHLDKNKFQYSGFRVEGSEFATSRVLKL